MKKEILHVVQHKNVLAFKNSAGELFEGIFNFIPEEGGKDWEMTVGITLNRSNNIFDKGGYEYLDRDNMGFKLPKIIPDGGCTTGVLLAMNFIDGDEIIIEHNACIVMWAF